MTKEYNDLEDEFMHKLNTDYDNLLLDRERVSNEYSSVNPLHAITSALDFLTSGIIKRTYHYWIDVKFRDIYPYKIGWANYEDYPFRLHKISIERMNFCRKNEELYLYYKGVKYQCNKSNILYLLQNFIGPKKCKLEKISLYRVDRTNQPYEAKYTCLYENKIYNISAFNSDIRKQCIHKIFFAWKKYLFAKHKKMFINVCNEIEYLPEGGYSGDMFKSVFKGGVKYIEVKNNTIMRFLLPTPSNKPVNNYDN